MKKVMLSEIPIIPFPEPSNYFELALRVKANSEDALIFISGRGHIPFNGDDKIFIVWDEPNKEFGKSFVTKYFDMKEPGILQWGHDGGIISLEK